jgi:hypothetical protein
MTTKNNKRKSDSTNTNEILDILSKNIGDNHSENQSLKNMGEN